MANLENPLPKQPKASIVVSESKSRFLSRKTALIAGGIIAVTILCAIGLVSWQAYKQNSIDASRLPEQMAASGDYTGAVNILQQQADNTNNKTTKAKAYTRLYQIATIANKPTDAMQYAQKADQAAPTANTAATLGFAANANSN